MNGGSDLQPGTDVAGYRIEALLGRGGMGVVYRATDLRLKRPVALKLVAPGLAADPRFQERFLREAELAASLDHSHVVPVYGAGETDGRLWMAMRFVEGEDLGTVLRREGPLEPRRAVALVTQVAGALDAAHERGLVHRDVKPANVLLAAEGGEEHCYLTDFGLARSSAAEVATTSPHLSGTVDYMAPEQIVNEPLDHCADVYALGCVLYECLGGAPPFARLRHSATLFAHVNESPPSLHERRPELPVGIDTVIARALAKDPAARYERCRDLADETRGVLGLGSPKLSRRRLLMLAGAVGAGVAAAAAAPAILLSRSDARPAGAAPILPLAGDSIVRIDPRTGELAAAVPAEGVTWVGATAGSVWFASPGAKRLTRVDPEQNAAAESFDLSRVPHPDVFTAGEGAVWITAGAPHPRRPGDRSFWRFDTSTGRLAASPAAVLETVPLDLAAGAGALWLVPDEEPHATLRIDAGTGEVAARIEDTFGLVAVGDGAVWTYDGGSLRRIDPQTNGVAATIAVDTEHLFAAGFSGIELAVPPRADLGAGEGAVWLLSKDDESVSRLDPVDGRITATVGVGRIPTTLAVGEGAVWVASARDRTVTRIDPRTLDVRTIEVGGAPVALAVGEGVVWVAVDAR